jgi:hypothetical protein
MKHEVSVGRVWHVRRHLNSSVATGITIESRATYDCPREGLSTEESRIIKQTLACELTTIENESGGARYVASSGSVATQRDALAGRVPDFPASLVIEQIAGEDELVSWTSPLGSKIQI